MSAINNADRHTEYMEKLLLLSDNEKLHIINKLSESLLEKRSRMRSGRRVMEKAKSKRQKLPMLTMSDNIKAVIGIAAGVDLQTSDDERLKYLLSK